jgi:flagellar motor protein MotB
MTRRVDIRRAAPARATAARTAPARSRTRPRTRPRPRLPSHWRRYRLIAAVAAVVGVIAALILVPLLTAHPNTTFNEIAIQPQPASPATVGADVAAELDQAVANGGQLVLAEIAGDTVAAPALDIELSCPPDTNRLICAETTGHAAATAGRVARALVDSPAPARLDFYIIFGQTAGYLSEHAGHHQAVNLWINTTGDQLSPVTLSRVTAGRDIPALVRQAVATGAFPGPHACGGYQVHMVVPPSGTPAHQQALRELMAALIQQCGGHLATWTERWITDSGAIPVRSIPHAVVTQHGRQVGYAVSDKLGDFAVGSATLTTTAKTALGLIAADIESRAPDRSVTCTGSTDGTGTSAFDLALSRRRAAAVCRYLARQGISSGLLRSVGTGKAVATGADPSLRRVVIRTTVDR